MMHVVAIIALLVAAMMVFTLAFDRVPTRAFLRDYRVRWTLVAVIILALGWGWLAGYFGSPAHYVYEPARYEDGKILPGRLYDNKTPQGKNAPYDNKPPYDKKTPHDQNAPHDQKAS